MSFRQSTFRLALSASLLGTALMSGSVVQSQETIARALLVEMAENQFSTLCQSEVFASCMGFTSKACLALSEDAIEQCLLPLPKEINMDELNNSTFEACPRDVYADAGYSEEKAGICFDKAMEEESKQ